MALAALTTAHAVDFVSVKDPSAHLKKVLIDKDDATKGTVEVVDGWDDAASVFKLSGLDPFLMGHIYDNAQTMSGREGTNQVDIHTKINQTNIEAVRFGLRAIPGNFCKPDGTPIKFETKSTQVNGRSYEAVTDTIIGYLGLRLINEMAQKIKDISEVSKDEEKN